MAHEVRRAPAAPQSRGPDLDEFLSSRSGISPAIGLIVMAAVALSHVPGGDGAAVARNTAIVGAILIAAEIVYLVMLRRHLVG